MPDSADSLRYDRGMSARAGVSVEEYLHSSFPDLDREYRDGEILERSLPDYLHGKVQLLLAAILAKMRDRFPVFPCVETRMKIRSGLYRIPDVALFYPDEPERIPEHPPLAVIEILSLDDRLSDVRQKLEEYREWGVPHVWLVDPHSRRMYTCETGLREVERLELLEFEFAITPSRIFQ